MQCSPHAIVLSSTQEQSFLISYAMQFSPHAIVLSLFYAMEKRLAMDINRNDIHVPHVFSQYESFGYLWGLDGVCLFVLMFKTECVVYQY
jgi:hypothetical protein